MPGAPVLVVEDDVRITSFFAMRLTSWINAIEARHGPSEMCTTSLQLDSNRGLPPEATIRWLELMHKC